MKRLACLALAEDPHLARKIQGVMAPIVSNESYLADRAKPLLMPKVRERRTLSGYPVHFPPRSALFVNARRSN
jgi:hypothetical protein